MVALVYLLTDDRMLQRGSVEPGHLPILAGIAAALETFGSGKRSHHLPSTQRPPSRWPTSWCARPPPWCARRGAAPTLPQLSPLAALRGLSPECLENREMIMAHLAARPASPAGRRRGS
jgi:hypothetical protein